MSETDLDSDETSSPRHDHQPKNAAPKGRKKREAKARFDSPAQMAVDGWGEPFEVECAPGYVAFWASEFDITRMTRRRWEPGCWGDSRIVAYNGAIPGKSGAPIKHRELSLMIMSAEDADAARANDPRLKGRAELREALWQRVRSSGDGRDRRGRVEEIKRNITV